MNTMGTRNPINKTVPLRQGKKQEKWAANILVIGRLCEEETTVHKADTAQHSRCVKAMKRAATEILMQNVTRN